jgi:hypothetical protein
MTRDERAFTDELDAFRQACEEASQHLYAYLAIHSVARHRRRVLRHVQDNALFWLTVTHALQMSSLLALGRVFDHDSSHNLSRLMRLAQTTPSMFSRAALRARRLAGGPEPPWLAEFLRAAYEPSAHDFRVLRSRVQKYRRIYEERYRQLRHHVFAHAVVASRAEADRIFARTNGEELKRLISSLLALHEALLGLFQDGRKPVPRRLRYSAKVIRGLDASQRPTTVRPHERIVVQAERVLTRAAR